MPIAHTASLLHRRSVPRIATIKGPNVGPSTALRRSALTVALILGCFALVTTSLSGLRGPDIGKTKQYDYYNLLVRGLLKGSVALDITPPAALVRLPNPWDVSQRPPGLAPADVSYYKGHFYTYFGIVPTLTVFLPFRLLTGRELPEVYGSLVFAVGAFLVSAGLWVQIARRQFTAFRGWLEPLGVLAIGLCGGQWALARRVSIWEPSITSGHCFMMAFAAAAYPALAGRKPFRWLSISGLCLALAVGCRPTLVLGGLGLAFVAYVVLTTELRRGREPPRAVILRTCWAFVPAAVVIAGLAAYNVARYGNPLEFGLHYQLTGGNEHTSTHFSLRYLPINAEVYLTAMPHWSRYFPFLRPISGPHAPEGYTGYEYDYGALIICPLLWGLAAWVFWTSARPLLGRFSLFVCATAIPLTLLTLCFNTAAARYAVDFIPWWVWLAVIGWANLLSAAHASRALRWLVATGFATTALVSVFLAFCASVAIHEVLSTVNPTAYDATARVFDLPAALWNRIASYHEGRLHLDVTFDPKRLSAVEPIVIAGADYERSYLFLFYQSDRSARFCYKNPVGAYTQGKLFTFEPGKHYAVEVSMGALFPPRDYLSSAGWPAFQIDAVKNRVLVKFDGTEVLDTPSEGPTAEPSSARFGIGDPHGYAGERFSGTVVVTKHEHLPKPAVLPPVTSTIDVSLFSPREPSPVSGPVVETGHPGDAVIVGLRRIDERSCQWTFETWSGGIIRGPSFAFPTDQPAQFRIQDGPALAIDDSSPFGILRKSLVVWRGSVPVAWGMAGFDHPASGPQILFSNAVGSSAAMATYPALVEDVHAGPAPAAWKPGPFRRLVLQLLGRGSGVEPLVATGIGPSADSLAICWLPGNQVRFLYVHGPERAWSPVIGLGSSELQTFEIEMPGFLALDRSGSGSGLLRVGDEFSTLWETSVDYQASPSSTLSVGRTRGGLLDCAPELRCVTATVHQE